MEIVILGIETSCDDTSVAVFKNSKILANITSTQDIHKEFGGVFPEKASRAHQTHIIPVADTALKRAGVSKKELSAIAFTAGPGLIGSLMVGASFAKALAFSLDIPLIAVHHTHAHIISHFIDEPKPSFPFICLTVSGGHTQIVLVNSYLDMKILGQTGDDAAGEAFDKAAKMFGLPYPGGPEIDRLAQLGNQDAFEFPIPKAEGYDFSFSGLKTSILYFIRKQEKNNPHFVRDNLEDLSASVQKTIVQYLMLQLEKACKDYNINEVAIAGGVSANSLLRKEFYRIGEERGWNTYIPDFQYCTDNGAMIAQTGYYMYLEKRFADLSVSPSARLEF